MPATQSSIHNRTLFQRALKDCIRTTGIDLDGSVLIVGGSVEDAQLLHSVGFLHITLANIDGIADQPLTTPEGIALNTVNADVEDMPLPDASYDLVLAHAVLHHCRSPHKALLEMLRVSRRHILLLEPNESLLMRLLVKLRLSFPYELPAVIANGFIAGGVRNTCIPNYIYRWNPRDLYQATASYLPESDFGFYTHQYWDFNVDEAELARRSETRIGSITRIVSPRLLLIALRAFQTVVNRLPLLSTQGNKFLGCVTKHDALKPWLVRHGAEIVFRRDYARPSEATSTCATQTGRTPFDTGNRLAHRAPQPHIFLPPSQV